MTERADLVIVGGGVVGCSAAWHLRQDKIVSEFVRLGRSQTFNVDIFAPDRFERGALVHDAATI